MRESSSKLNSLTIKETQTMKVIRGGDKKVMKKSISFILVLTLVFSMFATAAFAAVPTDTQGRYDALAAAGIFDGDGTGANLNGEMTREQLAKIITKVANLSVEPDGQVAATGFSDVASDRWSAGYINAVKKAKFMEGVSDTSFDPAGKVTIEQLATVLVRVLGLSVSTDAVSGTVSDWAKGFVAAAIKAGLISAQSEYTANAKRSALVDATFSAITSKTANAAIKADATSLAIGASTKVSVSGLAATDKVVYSVDKNGVIDSLGNFVATASGPSVVTAKINNASELTVTINVYGVAAAIQLAATASVPANNTTTGTITATIVDASGNKVENYNGTVNLAIASGTSVTLAATTATASKGVATVSFKSAAVGTSLLSASATGLTGSTLSVTTVAPKLASATLAADISTIAADSISNSAISVSFKDQAGVALLAGNYPAGLTVTLANSNTAAGALTNGTLNAGNNFAAATFTATTNIGSSNISATLTATTAADVAGITVAPIAINTAIIGSPYKLAVDTIADAYAAGATSTTQTVKVRVLDANGNQVTGVPVNVTLTEAVSATVANNGLATSVKGVATFTVTDTVAESVAYTASATGLVSATATGKFLAGPVASFSVAATPSIIAANGAATSTLKVSLKDAAGNAQTAGSFSVKFSKTTNNSATATFADTTVASVDGAASVTVVSMTNVATDTYTATVTYADATTSSQTVTVQTVILGTANKLSTPALGVNTATAGTDVTVLVNVQDTTSQTLTNDNGRTVSLAVANGTATVNTLSASTVNGVATFKVNLTTVGTYTVKATSAGVTDSLASANLAITANTAKSLKLTPTLATIAADGSTAIKVTATALDAYGNAATLNAANVSITASATTFGATSAGISNAEKVFTASTVPGVTTFTATNTTDALASATTTVTSVLTGAPSQLTVDPITAVAAAATQTIKVYVKDVNGNVVTSYNGPVGLTATGATVASSPVNAVLGLATFTASSTVAGTATYTASILSPALSATATGVINPGAATQITTSASPASILADGSSITTITIKAVDANNNVVAAENGTATITIPTGNDYVSLLATTAKLTNGVGTVQVRAKSLTGTANVTASYTVIGATNAVTSTVAVNTVAGAPSASLTTVSAALNQAATDVTVTVKDANGNNVTGLVLADFSATVAGTAQTITSVNPVGNAYTFSLTGTTGDAVVVKVKGVTITATTTIQ